MNEYDNNDFMTEGANDKKACRSGMSGAAAVISGEAGAAPYGEGLAPIYDAFIGEDYSYAAYADYIEKIFELHGKPQDSLIADLGCGTGSMCLELATRGYDMIGIDNSPHMLAVAREKTISQGAPEILFLEQELDSFELYGSVGAFISTIDSLNYITDKRRLRRMFRLVDNYLQPGGLFIFDVNTVYKLSQEFQNGIFYEITDEVCYLWENSYKRNNKTSIYDLTLFTREQGGLWRRRDEIHRQRAYMREDIEAAASDTKLSIVGSYGFLNFKRPLHKAKKVVYVMVKLQTTKQGNNINAMLMRHKRQNTKQNEVVS